VADGKPFGFTGKYFPLAVDDPVASGWDIVGGSIQEFKNQFITT
jgi:hypothetical protein